MLIEFITSFTDFSATVFLLYTVFILFWCALPRCFPLPALDINSVFFSATIMDTKIDTTNDKSSNASTFTNVTPLSSDGSTPMNTMLTDLADILRTAGLNVTEVSGWQTRGHSVMTSVKSILVHHTAGPATGDYPSLAVVRDGRPDLAGPLAQLGLGRSGTWFVIAAGRSYHAGKTIDDSVYGNPNAIGVEAEGTGLPADNTGHQNWPEVQWQSYVRGVQALRTAYGVPTARVLGHKEAAVPAGRKIDPNFSMAEFRAALG
jgi:hypothetical protein